MENKKLECNKTYVFPLHKSFPEFLIGVIRLEFGKAMIIFWENT